MQIDILGNNPSTLGLKTYTWKINIWLYFNKTEPKIVSKSLTNYLRFKKEILASTKSSTYSCLS